MDLKSEKQYQSSSIVSKQYQEWVKHNITDEPVMANNKTIAYIPRTSQNLQEMQPESYLLDWATMIAQAHCIIHNRGK